MSFVTIQNEKFYLDGSPWIPFGCTAYDSDNADAPYNQAHIDKVVNACLNGKFTTVRLTNFLRNEAGQDPYQETFWVGLDSMLDALKNINVKAILTFSDYSGILIGNGTNPFTANWTTFIAFASSRVNTVNGRVYSGDDTIWSVALRGEAYTTNFSGLTTTEITTFYQNMIPVVKTNFPNHLISAGGFNHVPNSNQNPDYQTIWALASVDYCSIHPYQASNKNPVLSDSDITSLTNTAISVGKPILLEEIGFLQSIGDKERANMLRVLHNKFVAAGGIGLIIWNIGTPLLPTAFSYYYTTTPFMWKMMQSIGTGNRIARIPVI